ncbi:cytochrome P450 [Dichomitus squalens]|nr:cytochrome P450 [Dichomitus squalens]
MFTLTLGGHETTSTTLTFLLYELARYPEYQERMRQEIRGVRAKVAQRGETEFSTEDPESLTLTNNAIKETLRFHPIVISLARVALKDGQVFSASFIGYQRLTEAWGEDANEWNPDRFLRSEISKQPANVSVFANLPGLYRMAILMQAFLAELVETFQYYPPKAKVDIQQAMAGIFSFPAIRGKVDQGSALPIGISLAQ